MKRGVKKLTDDDAIGMVEIDDGLHVNVIPRAGAEFIFSLHENNLDNSLTCQTTI